MAVASVTGLAQTSNDDPQQSADVQTAAPENRNTAPPEFAAFVRAAPVTLIGDTSHSQDILRFIGSDDVLDALQKAGKKYIGLEYMPYGQNAVDQLADGKISRDNFIRLGLAQYEAHDMKTSRDTRIDLQDVADLILHAKQRDIRIVFSDRLIGEDQVTRTYDKLNRAYQIAAARQAKSENHGGSEPTYGPVVPSYDILDAENRVSRRVNKDIVETMLNAMDLEEKRAGRHGLKHLGQLEYIPDFVIFIGAGHVEMGAEILNEKGLKANTCLVFSTTSDIGNYSEMIRMLPKTISDHVKDPEATTYLVRETRYWHEAPQPQPAMVAPSRTASPPLR